MLVRAVCEEEKMSKLIMFHARECPHCKAMMPHVERLETEEKIAFEKLEVWHNDKNADLMRSYRSVIAPKCGGQLRTPTFFNADNNDVLCGEVSYEKLKEWALKQG
jgi:thiol-disulfide isomerase/thioredoxin